MTRSSRRTLLFNKIVASMYTMDLSHTVCLWRTATGRSLLRNWFTLLFTGASAFLANAATAQITMSTSTPTPPTQMVADWIGKLPLANSEAAAALVRDDDNEIEFRVKPSTFDPFNTYLVQAVWLTGIGCPTNAKNVFFNLAWAFARG